MRKPPRPLGYHWDSVKPIALPGGARPCRWCKKPVPTRRHNWCGDERCITEWTRRTQPDVFRRVVFDRDRGVCALCGIDTAAFDVRELGTQLYLTRRAMLDASGRWRSWEPAPHTDALGQLYPPDHWLRLLDEAACWRARHRIPLDRSPWEVDHITPVIEGGDWFDMANLRTLCVPCHKGQTRQLAGRRARRRRGASLPT